MLNSYFVAWRKSFDFKSRSTRNEYWIFFLVNFILFPIIFVSLIYLQQSLITFSTNSYVSNALNSSFGMQVFNIAFQLIGILRLLLLPISLGHTWTLLPLTVRRIRDVGMKWQWIFFVSIPLLGFIFVLIFLTRNSVEEINGKTYYPKY